MVAQAGSAPRAVVCEAALAIRRKNLARRSSAHRRAGRKLSRSRRGGPAGDSQSQQKMWPGCSCPGGVAGSQQQFGFIQEENDDYKEHTVEDEYKSPPGSPQVELIID